MLKCKLALALWVASTLVASSAYGAIQPMSPSAAGVLVTSPWMTKGQTSGSPTDRVTVTTVTNGSSSWQTIHVVIFPGDWQQPINRDCDLSPMETTYFVFETFDANTTQVTFECSSQGISGTQTNLVETRYVSGTEGFMVAHIKTVEVTGPFTIKRSIPDMTDVLISDWTMVDFELGLAFSANAWHVKAITGSDGDLNIAFGSELDGLPTIIATSFIAPDLNDITAELILYNLNGAPGGGLPTGPIAPAAMGGIAYDDDEVGVSGWFSYDCFVVTSLVDIFSPDVLRRPGYFVGHATLFAQPVPNVGVVPTVGWIVQTIGANGTLNGNPAAPHPSSLGNGNGTDQLTDTMRDNAAWARPLLVTNMSGASNLNIDVMVAP